MARAKDIIPKDADSPSERLLLGFIDREVKRVVYGKIRFEITVAGGRAANIQATEIIDSLQINV